MAVKCKQSDVFHCDLPRRKQESKKYSSHGCHLLFYSILWCIHMTVSSKGFAIMCVRREACKIKGFRRKAADWTLQGTADRSVLSPSAAGASAYDFHFFPLQMGLHTWKKKVKQHWDPCTHKHGAQEWFVKAAQSHDKHRSILEVCRRRLPMHTPTIPPAVTLLQGKAGCVSRGAAGVTRSHSTSTPMSITRWQHCTTHSTACIERQECRKDPFLSKSYKLWEIYLARTHIRIYICMCMIIYR